MLGMAIAQVGLGSIALETSQLEMGLSYYRDALKVMVDIQASGRVMTTLMEIGSQLKKVGQPTAALAILALVYHHPDTLSEIKNRAGEALTQQAASDLPVDQLLDDKAQATAFIQSQTDLLANTLDLEPNYWTMWLSALGAPARTGVLPEPLTQREHEVLQLMAVGMSNREIAEQLVIGVGTVKTHALNVYGKLDVRSRTQAVVRAQELRLLSGE